RPGNGSHMRVPSTSALILGLALSVWGCHTTPPTATLRADPPAVEPGDPGDRCLRYAGPPGDPSPGGLARAEATRCCASGCGCDTHQARQRCGFAGDLGESEAPAWVHRCRGAGGRGHALWISPFV